MHQVCQKLSLRQGFLSSICYKLWFTEIVPQGKLYSTMASPKTRRVLAELRPRDENDVSNYI